MSLPNLLPAVELNPAAEPQACVIWLHGLGADGYDFVPIVEELDLPDEAAIRFVFPHAPKQPVTINGGYIMPAWYDIRTPNLRQQEDETGIRESVAALNAWIDHEAALGIPASRILLAGFSQGGAIALFAGLTYPARLAGIMALSTYLPLPQQLSHDHSPYTSGLPVFVGHGNADTIVPPEAGVSSAAVLQGMGCDVSLHRYDMAHSVNQEEIRDIRSWLLQYLG